MGWQYIEPCCGSAAIALALLGARRSLLPYQGSKWRLRRALLPRLRPFAQSLSPRRVELSDPGPWGVVAPTVLRPELRAGVIERLDFMDRLDPGQVYDALHQHPVPADPVEYSAQYLFLQRLSYSGKAVGEREGCWSSPGFNKSSAYGLAGTERFGRVKPMIPSLIRVLRSYDELLRPEELCGGRRPARAPRHPVQEETVVYIDPPYAGSTAYPAADLERSEVVALALAWAEAGASVYVSEGEGIDALVARGWRAERVDAGRSDRSRFRGKQQEWLTWTRVESAAAPLAARLR